MLYTFYELLTLVSHIYEDNKKTREVLLRNEGGSIMENVIGAVLLGIVATVCFVISYFQFNEKGYLFNNAYIYASKQEKETMDKKPHYKQSGIIFLMLGFVFLISVIEILIETGWLMYIMISITIVAIIYAIVSSVVIERKRK